MQNWLLFYASSDHVVLWPSGIIDLAGNIDTEFLINIRKFATQFSKVN